jgi:NAD(P)-dependent dehydrogenase (short-subunit alcohol dehydrogenase family)
VAVVTGGGSGIGAGLCRRFAAEGMSVVVDDVDAKAAETAAEALRATGSRALGVACDVSKRDAVEALAAATLAEFGRVDIVCNNAGVFLGDKMREFTAGDWEWVIGVNLMGVVHGASVFAELLIAQGSGHIVNTASIGGFSSDPNCAPYTTSKFAVVGYSEALRADLAQYGVGVSMLCPGPVATGIDACDRLRPDWAGDTKVTSKAAVPVMEVGISPDRVAGMVLRGIEENATYIFTHPEFGATFEPRLAAIRAALAVGGDAESADGSLEALTDKLGRS